MHTKIMRRFFISSVVVFMLAWLMPGASQSQGNLEFTSSTITVGRGARGLVIGDFNRDGNPDVVSLNESASNLTVLLGNGAGGFSSMTNVPLGLRPRAGTTFGDSLAVTFRGDDVVFILPPDGQGSFRVDQAVRLTVGNTNEVDGPTAIVIADFNNDGIDDLATAEIDGDTVTLLLGKTDGTFEQPRFTSLRVAGTPTAMDADPRSLAAADFNGDGKLDLVTANHDSGTVAILTGDGAGNFQVQIKPIGNNPIVALTGDFDKNETEDVVVTDRTTGTLIFLPGNGMGNFDFGDEFTVDPGGRPEASTLADMNGDGNVDVVVASRDGNKVFVMLGDGAGNFSVGGQANVGGAPRAVAAVDLNKDGKLDIVVANSGDGTLTVLLQR